MASSDAHQINDELTIILNSIWIVLQMLEPGHPGRVELYDASAAAQRCTGRHRQLMSWISYQLDKILAEIVTREGLRQALKEYVSSDDFQKLESKVNANQQHIDTIATKLAADDQIIGQLQTGVATIATGVTSLQASNADLQAQIDALKQQNPTLDFTAVDAAMASVATDLGTVKTAADGVVTKLQPTPTPLP
jgi:septal ring factor EnvC (AmiA/AmiB activator)